MSAIDIVKFIIPQGANDEKKSSKFIYRGKLFNGIDSLSREKHESHFDSWKKNGAILYQSVIVSTVKDFVQRRGKCNFPEHDRVVFLS